jgi:hypothetical protein
MNLFRHLLPACLPEAATATLATKCGAGAFVTFPPAVSLCVRLLQGDEVEEVEDPLFSFIAAAGR